MRLQFAFHKLEIRGGMLKKLVITLAKIVKARVVIAVANKTIFGTFAMTGKAETALLTLPGQKGVLQSVS